MNKEKIKTFNDIIATHNQFTHNSLLWEDIRDVWGVSDWKAKKLSRSYCNFISFYGVCSAAGIITDDLKRFMLYLKFTSYIDKDGNITKKNLLDKDGYMRGKKQILEHYGFSLNEIYFENYNCFDTGALDDKYFYQMRMSTGIRSKHFIGCYVENGELYLSCSTSRGNGVLAKDKISKKEFDWLLQIS